MNFELPICLLVSAIPLSDSFPVWRFISIESLGLSLAEWVDMYSLETSEDIEDDCKQG
jgi:hypothetical protein